MVKDKDKDKVEIPSKVSNRVLPNTTISIYLTGEDIQAIDQIKGSKSISKWVKGLIQKEINKYEGG